MNLNFSKAYRPNMHPRNRQDVAAQVHSRTIPFTAQSCIMRLPTGQHSCQTHTGVVFKACKTLRCVLRLVATSCLTQITYTLKWRFCRRKHTRPCSLNTNRGLKITTIPINIRVPVAQLESGYSRFRNDYMSRIDVTVVNICLTCSTHDAWHLFKCQQNPVQVDSTMNKTACGSIIYIFNTGRGLTIIKKKTLKR